MAFRQLLVQIAPQEFKSDVTATMGMATDHATAVETEGVESESTAYISPTADFLLLFGATLLVALTAAAVITP